MILNVKTETVYKQGYDNVTHTIMDAKTGNEIGIASNYVDDYFKLHVGNQTYEFRNYPKLVKKSQPNFKYPFSSKWKRTIGFGIYCDRKEVGVFYGDAMRCRNTGRLQSNDIH